MGTAFCLACCRTGGLTFATGQTDLHTVFAFAAVVAQCYTAFTVHIAFNAKLFAAVTIAAAIAHAASTLVACTAVGAERFCTVFAYATICTQHSTFGTVITTLRTDVGTRYTGMARTTTFA